MCKDNANRAENIQVYLKMLDLCQFVSHLPQTQQHLLRYVLAFHPVELVAAEGFHYLLPHPRGYLFKCSFIHRQYILHYNDAKTN